MGEAIFHIVGGFDLEAREARKAARQHARPILARWIKEGEAYARGDGKVKLRQAHVALMRELANYPSANHGHCYASQARLGQKIGAAQRTARLYLADLIAAGLLTTQRRGFGRTSLWTFCIDGAVLFPDSDRHAHAASDRHAHAASDRHAHAAKPYRVEPIEVESLESLPPSPPPCPELRARGSSEVAAEIMAAVPEPHRHLAVWRSLPAWIEEHCRQPDVLQLDVVLGVTSALPSLRGATLSTLRYFDRSVRRASEARRRPLADASPTAVLLRPYSAEWTAERDRKVAAGQDVRRMDSLAETGTSWIQGL